MVARVFGNIPGVTEGTEFDDRTALHNSDVHRPPQAGISGSQHEGADSIVVSGGYEDDEDYGDTIVYTGHGGRDATTGKQIADQELTAQNLALARSCDEGLPVRVVRGAGGDPAYSPSSGYRYDGLYFIDQYWHKRGRSGFRVQQYRLIKAGGGLPREPAAPGQPVGRTETTVQRQVRSSEVAQQVKILHKYQCQVCGIVVETPSGPYAEAAHIQPLGRPHDGPDNATNVLCLCPNDHIRFDKGAIYITDGFQVIDALTGDQIGNLRKEPDHNIGTAHLEYHRTRFTRPND